MLIDTQQKIDDACTEDLLWEVWHRLLYTNGLEFCNKELVASVIKELQKK